MVACRTHTDLVRRHPYLVVFVVAALVMVASWVTSYLRGHDQLCLGTAGGWTCSPPQDAWVAPCNALGVVAAVVCLGVVLAWLRRPRVPRFTFPRPSDP